ncbi:MAG: hypothetical protein AAF628_34395 [Planctomycetota bacterium]
MESPELFVIGLTCNLVGVFFLANSIIFRRPRKVIEEFFGVGAGSLETIRDYALNKIQVVIGFLFLNAGFLLLAFATLDAISQRAWTAFVCAGIVVFAVVVYLVGAYYSRQSFKRYLQEFFQKHAWSFTENMAMTKEIGTVMGIHHTNDMTVEEFVFEVKKALGVPPHTASTSGIERSRRLRDARPVAGRP